VNHSISETAGEIYRPIGNYLRCRIFTDTIGLGLNFLWWSLYVIHEEYPHKNGEIGEMRRQ